MAKYSTGKSSGGKDDSCQLCGTTDKPLTTAKMEGATVTVCRDCEPDEANREDNTPDSNKRGGSSTTTTNTSTDESTVPGYTLSQPNPDWVEGVSYGNTETPYMKSGYAKTFTEALADHDITIEELAEETGAPVESLEALKNGNAVGEDIGGNVVKVVEEVLDIELKEEV